MKLIREVTLMEMAQATPPRYYGVAWADPVRAVVVIAVVPLNRMIQIVRDVGLRVNHLLRADHSWAAARERAAYVNGWSDAVRVYSAVTNQEADADVRLWTGGVSGDAH